MLTAFAEATAGLDDATIRELAVDSGLDALPDLVGYLAELLTALRDRRNDAVLRLIDGDALEDV